MRMVENGHQWLVTWGKEARVGEDILVVKVEAGIVERVGADVVRMVSVKGMAGDVDRTVDVQVQDTDGRHAVEEAVPCGRGERELGELGEVGSYGGHREQPITTAIAIAPATNTNVTAAVDMRCHAAN